MWEDPLIPTISARLALPAPRVMHPRMTVNDLINGESNEWNVGLLENYVHHDDIPLIRSFAISPANCRDILCWNYTKSGQYMFKSGYWIARNLLENDEEIEIMDPSITKLQAFSWKIKAPQKICYLIWQLIT